MTIQWEDKVLAGATNAPTGRHECLDKARTLVSKDRNKDYGDPEDNFREIAAIQAVIARCKDPILKVALDTIAVKLARLVNSPKHLDSWVDIAGYAACGYDIASRQRPKLEESATTWLDGEKRQ